MTAERASCRLALLTVILLAVGASLLDTDAARGADRTDPIPSSVGPPGDIGFYVNPNAPGLDATRVEEIIRRSLARWGDRYLGTTTNAPGVADGQNVIGVAELPPNTLGLTQTRSSEVPTGVAPTQTCVPSSREPTDTVVRRNRSRIVRLRRDRVVRGRVRRASVRRRLRVAAYTLVKSTAVTQLCTLGDQTTALAPALEVDVSLAESPGGSNPWALGPALPTPDEFDFETNALHELGHVSGLAHQIDRCDPSTPLPVSQAPGEYWHAPIAGEWLRPGCPAPAAAAPIAGADSAEPLPGPGATALAGHSILINPRVPAGYDSARFVSVAERAIRRAGGMSAGLSDIVPANGDGNSVLGFATLGAKTLSSSNRTPRRQVIQAYNIRACRKARVRTRTQAVVRRLVRIRGRRLRRDAIRTRRRNVSGYRCTRTSRPAQTNALAPELDLRINDRSIAWELGPRFPADGTRADLETAILQNVMAAGGAPAGAACDTATPNSSSGVAPGDWWRSTSEVRRSRCVAGGPFNARTLRTAGGHGLVHRVSAIPDDVRDFP